MAGNLGISANKLGIVGNVVSVTNLAARVTNKECPGKAKESRIVRNYKEEANIVSWSYNDKKGFATS